MAERWEILSKTLLVDRLPWLRLWEEQVRLPTGQVIPDWLRLEMPRYVVFFAVTVERTVPLIRCYKHGAACMMVTLPGGYIDPGEEPLAAAQRELLEETGLASDHWTQLADYVVDANREAGRGCLFLAREARQVTEPDDGDLEQIELFFHPLDQVRAVWRSAEMLQFSSSACIALALDELGLF